MAQTYRQHRFRAPAGSCEILLVRHGESEPAVPGTPFPLVDGHGDPALAPEGREQADAVGRRLADAGLTAVYVSTLRRTTETAAPLLARLGIEAQVEPDLREVHLGDWEGGLFRQRVAEGDPIVAQLFAEERWDAIPGAEAADAFAARVRGAIERIADANPGGRVAAFSHGGVIAEALHQASGSRPLAFVGVDNGSISHLVVTPERWIVRRVNDTGHLPDDLDRPTLIADPAQAARPQDPSTGFSA